MILITRIEYTNMGDVEFARRYRNPVPVYTVGEGSEPSDYKVDVETIQGREFIFPDGERIRIGLPENEAKFLGVHAEAWQDLERQRDYWYEEGLKLARQLDQLRAWGFWARLKFLFTKEI